MSREEIISAIRQGDQRVLAKLYSEHRYQFIVWFINRYKCSKEEAMELYQKVIITFYEAIQAEKIEQFRSGVDTLLIGIGKNIYHAHKRKTERDAEVDGFYLVDEDPLDEMYIEDQAEVLLNKSKIKKVENLLGKIGKDCQSILELFYYQNLPLREIAKQLGIEDEKLVKSRKFRCLQRLRELLNTSY